MSHVSARAAVIAVAIVIATSACGAEHGPDQGGGSVSADDDALLSLPTPSSPGTRTIYVPAYSHLSGGRDRRMLLAITLSVRNVDPVATITLTQVEYFDTSGHRVRRYLREPRALTPLATAEFSVDTLDETGGSGANFLVYWEGPETAHPLLTEAIMFGHMGTGGYMSFTSRGVELERPPVLDPAPRAATEP